MDREDIIRMAQECQFAHYYESGDLVAMPQLERFAALVAAHEREQCALIAAHILKMPQNDVSTAIRIRGMRHE